MDHLWFAKKASPLVSLTPSFLSVLKKAMSISSNSETAKITLVDGRVLASTNRVYHAIRTVRALRQKRVEVPPRYWGRFEYWAWQKVTGIIGSISLEDFKQWAEADAYLGRLLCNKELSSMSVSSFRTRCGLSNLSVCPSLGHSIASLFRLFKPTTFDEDVQLKDFVRVIFQNFNITDDLESWTHDHHFTEALSNSLMGYDATPPAQPIALSTDSVTQPPQRFHIVRDQQLSLMDETSHEDDNEQSASNDEDEDSPLISAARSVDSDLTARIASLEEADISSNQSDEDMDVDVELDVSTAQQNPAELLQRFQRSLTPASPSPSRTIHARRLSLSSLSSSESASSDETITEAVSPLDMNEIMDDVERQFPPISTSDKRDKRAVSPHIVDDVLAVTMAGSPGEKRWASRFGSGLEKRTVQRSVFTASEKLASLQEDFQGRDD